MHNRYILKTKNPSYLYLSLIRIDDSFKAETHSHENLEILYIVSGNGYIITNDLKTNVKASDLIILNSNTRHFESGDNLTFYALGISKINFNLKDDLNKKIIKISLNENIGKQFHYLYEIAYNEVVYLKDSYNDVIENIINIILINLKRETSLISNNIEINDDELVSNIKSIINNYYYTNINLDDIAKRLSLSKSLICHKFKKETGKTIISYKIDKQLEEAKNMLEISDTPIGVISSMVGFNSVSYFIVLFKRKYNILPNKIRKKPSF